MTFLLIFGVLDKVSMAILVLGKLMLLFGMQKLPKLKLDIFGIGIFELPIFKKLALLAMLKLSELKFDIFELVKLKFGVGIVVFTIFGKVMLGFIMFELIRLGIVTLVFPTEEDAAIGFPADFSPPAFANATDDSVPDV